MSLRNGRRSSLGLGGCDRRVCSDIHLRCALYRSQVGIALDGRYYGDPTYHSHPASSAVDSRLWSGAAAVSTEPMVASQEQYWALSYGNSQGLRPPQQQQSAVYAPAQASHHHSQNQNQQGSQYLYYQHNGQQRNPRRREPRRTNGNRGNAGRGYGTSGRGGQRRNGHVIVPRAPSWADADWHPMKAVAASKNASTGQVSSGTGVFLPAGSAAVQRTSDDGSKSPPHLRQMPNGNHNAQVMVGGHQEHEDRSLPDEWVY